MKTSLINGIERTSKRDAMNICMIAKEAFPEAEEKFLLDELYKATILIVIRNEKSTIVAFGAANKIEVENEPYVYMSLAASKIKEKGFHTEIIKKRIEWAKEIKAKEIRVSVRCKNLKSLRNLLSCNFKPFDTFIYENGDEGLDLKLKLD